MNEAVPLKDAPAGQADASFAEITARRRGRLRRYLHRRPRVMDAVVVACYHVLVAPTMVDAILQGFGSRRGCSPPWHVILPSATLSGGTGGVHCGDGSGRDLLHPWGSNVSAGLWFSLYAVAVVHTRRFALVAIAAGDCTAGPAVLLAAVGPMERELPSSTQRRPGSSSC